jgi:Icc-related predicted phosphoesterase
LPLLRILHFSDLHGVAMRLAESTIEAVQPNWIVLTGDILPDFSRLPGESRRLAAQREWWRTWRSSFLREGIRTTFVRGNHEIEGFEDRSLRSVPGELAGMVGFLEGIPARWGAWGFAREWDEEALQQEVEAMGEPFVVMSHVPPHGWLDVNGGGDHIGHLALREFLDASEVAVRSLTFRGRYVKPPGLVLCGHVHQGFGWERHGPTLVVNAATGFAVVDLDLGSGVAHVLRMERLLEGRPDPYL